MKFQVDIGREVKQKKDPILPQDRIYLFVGIILVFSLLKYPHYRYSRDNRPLEKKIATREKDIDMLKRRAQVTQKKIKAIAKKRISLSHLRHEGIRWSEKLIFLSHAIPKYFWLTSISEKETRSASKKENKVVKADELLVDSSYLTDHSIERTLIIEGEVLPLKEESYLKRITRFTADLNSSPSFYEDLEPIFLYYSKPSKSPQGKKGVESVIFELRGKFKL